MPTFPLYLVRPTKKLLNKLNTVSIQEMYSQGNVETLIQ